MMKEINVTIENKFLMEKRDLNVYHHSTGSAHMISHNSSITVPLKPVMEDDYVDISVVVGPGYLGNKSVVNMPSWVDFEFTSGDRGSIIRSGDRTLLKIPAGLPTWQLRMTRPDSLPVGGPSDRVIVGDDPQAF